MRRSKAEITSRMCSLASTASEAFKRMKAADCFCSVSSHRPESDFNFDEEVMEFIEKAVTDAIAKKKEDL